MKKTKRRTYLVDKASQFRYMGLVVIPLIVLLAALYYLIYYSVFTEILIPEAIVSTLLPAMEKVNLVALVVFPIALVVILRISLVYSNRIVGPILRLEKDLDKVIAGNSSLRLKTRDNDQLKAFIGKVNLVLDKVDTRSQP